MKTKKINFILFLAFALASLSSCLGTSGSSSSASSSLPVGDSSSSSSEGGSASSSVSSSTSVESIYFDVFFRNYDNSLLYQTKVLKGQTAEYKGATPTRPAEEGITYTFSGWNRDNYNIQDNTDFIAQYTIKKEVHVVKFLNFDSSLLDIENVLYGEDAVYHGDTPEKPSDNHGVYTFSGWDGSLIGIKADCSLTAEFTQDTPSYVVKFYNYDDVFLYETEVKYGEKAEFVGTTPTKPINGRYSYTFSGWDKKTDFITDNLEVKAVFTQKVRDATTGLAYSYVTSAMSYKVVGYTGTATEVYVPLTFDDGTNGKHMVYMIDDNAFSNKNITSVYLENNITSIGNSAFSSCYQLASIALSENLASIAPHAFQWCQRLASIKIPASLTSVGEGVFQFCNSLDSVSVAEGSKSFVFEDGILYSKDKKIIWLSLSSISGDLVIKDGVEEIQRYAFSSREKLTSVTLSSSVSLIGYGAFQDCHNLKKAILKDCVLTDTSGGYLFSNDSSLTAVDLGTKLTRIGDGWFSSCSALESINIPASVTVISYPFNDCLALSSITVSSDSKNYYSDGKIVYTKSLSSIVVAVKKGLDDIVFPEGLKTIDSNAFSNCNSLVSISIPSTLTSIGYRAFSECNNLETVTFNDCALSANGWGIFSNCQKLTSISLGNKFIGISGSFISGCTSLKTLYIPKSVNSISSDAFSSCYLASITVASDSNYFAGNGSVLYSKIDGSLIIAIQDSKKSYTLVEGVKKIFSFNCFINQSTAESIYIPSSITYIYFRGLNSFSSLQYFLISTNNKTYSSDGTTVTSDDGKTLCFKITKATKLEIPEGITKIGEDAFYNKAFTSVVLSSTVETISSQAFSSCYSLTTVAFDDKLKTIGSSAFSNCNQLKEAILPEGLETIDSSAFSSCGGLKTIVIPSSVTTLGFGCFSNLVWSGSASTGVFFYFVSKSWEKDLLTDHGMNKASIFGDLSSAYKFYFYSETEDTNGGWHYDADGKPVPWVASSSN